jgi:hypothetical protein
MQHIVEIAIPVSTTNPSGINQRNIEKEQSIAAMILGLVFSQLLVFKKISNTQTSNNATGNENIPKAQYVAPTS